MTINSLGLPNGVTFGNENLSQYDENTSFTFADASGAGLSITTTRCRTIRVGNLVFINAAVGYPVTASGASARLTIPIATSIGSALLNCLSTSTTLKNGFLFSGGLDFYDSNNTGMSNAQLSNKTVYITGCYEIA